MMNNKIKLAGIISMMIFLAACGNGNSKVDQVIQNQMLEADGNVAVNENANEDISQSDLQSETNVIDNSDNNDVSVTTVEDMNAVDVDLSNADENIDVDLTKLSSTMVYSEVYNMMYTPNDYIDKTIRMRGNFVVYSNPDETIYYPSVIIADATACCSQGLEFLVEGNPNYPEGYPKLDSEVSVTGVFETYEEDGYLYCRLKDATWTY